MADKKEKKEDKRPLDMTTDEAMEYLLGQQGAHELKQAVKGMNPPPDADNNGSTGKNKSARKHGTT